MAHGDHLRVFRGFYWHHGIDCGDGTVIHYTGTPTDIKNAAVKHEPIAVFSNGKRPEVVAYTFAFDAETTITRARSRLGEKEYNLAFNNCEHFARWCRTGEHESEQVNFVSGIHPTADFFARAGQKLKSPDGFTTDDAFQFFTPYAKSLFDTDFGNIDISQPWSFSKNMAPIDPTAILPALNVGLGVANLGVGLYNAYRSHVIERTVVEEASATRDEVRINRAATEAVHRDVRDIKQRLIAGFDHVQHMLEYQNGLLYAIQSQQNVHNQKLDIVISTLVDGFETMEELIASVTDLRRQDDYTVRLQSLNFARKQAVDSLILDGELTSRDISRLRENAESLEIFLEARLKDSDLHRLSRQSLILALVDARVAQIDALMFEDPENNQRRAAHLYEDLCLRVRKEARLLLNNVTPWEVATALRGQIHTYVTLYRTLRLASELLERAIPIEALRIAPWHDTLPVEPLQLSPSTSEDTIQMNSLADYQWLVRAFELDPLNDDISRLSHISVETIAKRLGASTPTVDFQTARPYTLPETWKNYGEELNKELGFNPEIQLRPAELTPATPESSSPINTGWDTRGTYEPTDHFFSRYKTKETYRVDIKYKDNTILHLYTKLKDGHCAIAIYSFMHDGRMLGPEFAETMLEKGHITFEIPIPGMDETCTFQINGTKAQYKKIVEITDDIEKVEFPVLALYRRSTTY